FESSPIRGSSSTLKAVFVGSEQLRTIPFSSVVPGENLSCSSTRWQDIIHDSDSVESAEKEIDQPDYVHDPQFTTRFYPKQAIIQKKQTLTKVNEIRLLFSLMFVEKTWEGKTHKQINENSDFTAKVEYELRPHYGVPRVLRSYGKSSVPQGKLSTDKDKIGERNLDSSSYEMEDAEEDEATSCNGQETTVIGMVNISTGVHHSETLCLNYLSQAVRADFPDINTTRLTPPCAHTAQEPGSLHSGLDLHCEASPRSSDTMILATKPALTSDRDEGPSGENDLF
ncbi:hypothetical protein A6R68_09303, partial [Neotoma lepida]